MGTDDVTLAEVARSLVRIETKVDRSLDRIEQKIDKSLGDLDERFSRTVASHDSRLTRLERIAWIAVGLGAGSSGISIWSLFGSM